MIPSRIDIAHRPAIVDINHVSVIGSLIAVAARNTEVP